jgi:hypothetical protein
MFGIPTFDLLSDAGKQEFIEYIVNLVRKEINSYTPSYNNTGTSQTSVANGYYGAFSDYTNQTAASVNTAYAMTFNTTDLTNGVVLSSPTSRVLFTHAGIYNLQWSGQFENTASQDANVRVWMRINGTDVVGSTGLFTVPSKHGSHNGTHLIGWNFILKLFANDYVELYWSTTSTTTSIKTYAAGTSPVSPSTASLILTAQQVTSV